nr:hypothetical protein GCM10020093_102580 [Planobispora longispora]
MSVHSVYRVLRTPSRRISMRVHLRAAAVVLGLLAAACGIALAAMGTGSAVPVGDVVMTLLGRGDAMSEMVVFELRAPGRCWPCWWGRLWAAGARSCRACPATRWAAPT